MTPASASVWMRDLVAAAPDGAVPLLHPGHLAIYVEISGRCVGVLSKHASAVPCGLRTVRDSLEATTAHVHAGVLHLDDEAFPVRRVVDVSVPRLACATSTPAPAPGDVASMVGRGDGLTPYGDDVLCGWLATHRAAGLRTPAVDAAIAACAHRTTALSRALLECAGRGEVLPEFAAWLSAVGTDQEDARAADLVRVGHSSGRGLLEGARLALAHLRPLAPTHRGAA
ncbi:hypothetical protein GCM10011519_29240 [Marmoricola endophyticus]|uniref:DUF2877 domain-containing protein n=1 Tax=Marmoricola endophyticus TaxID=2040280 RepID=A0A917F6W9_9ACTN|nr:DUF2877 domain-containing protein [Marmoricola endophyticus]GGF53469.1 hypothetical protein GCM10011519_29240 [Marmoricola endophyticus]